MRWWHGVACCGAECPALFRGSTLRCCLPVCKLTGVADHPSSPVLLPVLPSMCYTGCPPFLYILLFLPLWLSTVENWFCSLYKMGPVWLLKKGLKGSSGCLMDIFLFVLHSCDSFKCVNCFRWMLINIFVVHKLPVWTLSCLFCAFLLLFFLFCFSCRAQCSICCINSKSWMRSVSCN